jgi:hypothetical protein
MIHVSYTDEDSDTASSISFIFIIIFPGRFDWCLTQNLAVFRGVHGTSVFVL